MIDNSKISELAQVYDTVIPIGDKFSLVSIKGRFGIVGNITGDIAVSVIYDKYSIFDIEDEPSIVALTNQIDGITVIFNCKRGKVSGKYNGLYNIKEIFNGVIIICQICTSNNLGNIILIREHDLREIINSNNIVEMFNGGSNDCRVLFYCDNEAGIAGRTYYKVNKLFEVELSSIIQGG